MPLYRDWISTGRIHASIGSFDRLAQRCRTTTDRIESYRVEESKKNRPRWISRSRIATSRRANRWTIHNQQDFRNWTSVNSLAYLVRPVPWTFVVRQECRDNEGLYDDMESYRRSTLLERQRESESKRFQRIRGDNDKQDEQPEKKVVDRGEPIL